jgi:molecular chaperone GrpE (heat shock protein)
VRIGRVVVSALKKSISSQEEEKMKAPKLSKTDLERSLLDMIEAATRLTHTRRNDAVRAGSYSRFRQDFRQYEKRVRRAVAKGRISNLDKLAEEVVNLVGELCKSLIHYIFSFLVGSQHIGVLGNDHWAYIKNDKDCS